MAVSKVTLWNQALITIGNQAVIADVDEISTEAEAFNVLYDSIIEELLMDTDWPWAERYSDVLSELATNPVVDRWAFVFTIPADVVRIREVFDAVTPVNTDEPIPFAEYNDPVQDRVIATDIQKTRLRYTGLIDIGLWPGDFVNIAKFRLAAEVSPKLTTDPAVTQGVFNAYERTLSRARSNIVTVKKDVEESEFDRARA